MCAAARLVAFLTLAGCAVAEGWPDDSGRPVAPGSTSAGALEGTVTDPDGLPLPGALLTTEPRGVETSADEDGTWRFERLLPGRYRVLAAAPGRQAGWSAEVEVRAGETASTTVAVLPPEVVAEGTLRVRVNGPEHTPLPGAVVTASSGGTVVSGETGDDGAVTLEGLGGFLVEVHVEEPAGRLHPRSATVEVPPRGGADLAFTLSGIAAEGTRSVGSALCAMCHVDEGASWQTTAHSRAQSAVEGEPAVGFDAEETIDLRGALATLTWVDGVATVELTSTQAERRSYPVAGLIGGADRGAVPWTEIDGVGWPLPVAWVAADPRNPGWADGGWIARDASPMLDDDGAFAESLDPAASAEARCFGCHATGFDLAESGAGVAFTPSSGSDPRWVEAAVGCEACHGPGEEHTAGAYSAKARTITNPANLDLDRGNEVCAQCHGALAGNAGTPYAWSEEHGRYQPGDTLADHAASAFLAWNSGAARVPGAQADELALSAHGGETWGARCADCHDPHGRATRADLRLEVEDNTLCLSCHAALSFSATSAEEHAGHAAYAPDALSGEGRCVGCHMPQTAARTAWSVASGAGDLASHRFAAVPPSDSVAAFDAVGADVLAPGEFAPNACQECHAWGAWRDGADFGGPTGPMTERATHEALQTAFSERYP